MRVRAGADYAVMAGCGFSGDGVLGGAVAVAVRGDRIVWTGPPAALADAVAWSGKEPCGVFEGAKNAMAGGASLPVLEFPEGFLMPGFHDAHIHMFHTALYLSPLAERYCGENEADAVARLAPLAARRPEGGWLLTQGWRDYLWNPPVAPTKASLDAAYPNRPVAMYSGDAHTLWLNSCALERLGITESSVPPAGGSYDKDASGRLTGIVREAAAMQLMPRIVAEFPPEELLDAYRGLFAQLNAEGITSVCDVSLMALPGLDFVRDDLYQQLLDAGQLTVRTHLFPTLLDGSDRLAQLQQQLNHPLLQAQGYKQFFDGVSSQHTAWVHSPYTNPRFPGDNGRPTVEPQEMRRLLAKAHAEGQPVRIHAIGDEAIHQLLDFFEEEAAADGALAEPRNAIEHLENFQPADMGRLARLGVVASVQPRHITLDPGGPERDLGPARVPYMWPFRTLLDEGATLAFGTDSPVTATNPLDAVYTAVTRQDADTHQPEGGWLPAQCITAQEALRAYTVGSAAAANRGHELGRLAPGYLADFIVLDRNVATCEAADIQKACVRATFVGGRRVF
ncbi:amidohydrolase [Parvibacter caecicola]|nr:amidohydrolase [Parvibacter caecicola]